MNRVYCSGCGLQIYGDEALIPYKNNDVYHDLPYPCYPFEREYLED